MSTSQLPYRSIISSITSHLKIMITEFFHNFNIGACARYFINLTWSTMLSIKMFVLPTLSQSENDFAERYGPWAVVTGATDGIGSAYAKELAARKMNIVLVSRTEENLKKVAAEIESEFTVQTKTVITNFAEGRHVYERIEKELRNLQIGVLVNNVGMNVPSPLLVSEMTEDLMWNIVNVNCVPVLILIRMILPRMLRNRRGAIVNVSSMIDLQPTPLIAVYSATKAFITVFTKALQLENRGNGVTIQILSPGMRNSENAGTIPEKAKNFVKRAISTLGHSGSEAESSLHSILMVFMEMMPVSLKTFFINTTSRILKSPCSKNKVHSH